MSSMTRRLILFDLDGTLLISDGLGRRALDEAFAALYGWETACEGISFSGMTDPLIVAEVFAKHGRDAQEAEREEGRVFEHYVGRMRTLLASRAGAVRALPGAAALLERLAGEARAFVGVLTGNVEGGARAKLRASGLGDAFYRAGAYGDDARDRPGLLPVALERANSLLESGTSPWRPEEVVIVGDTPRDVGVARAHGARAVAVATGWVSSEELASHRPDALLDTLECLESALHAVLA
ncbi:MAG TPA: hypothetical protein DEA08_24905 [Planctomycetes bacterium]|nr:hypothetical protein [Planctomycetota bacterium]